MATIVFLLLLATLYAATRAERGWVDLLFLVTLAVMLALFLHHATDRLNINL
jgi:hypothetical protein